MMPLFFVFHPLKLPARRISPGHTSTKALPGTTDCSKAEYTNTQQDLPVGNNYFTNSRHEWLFGHWGFFG
jgi:hypothetical protein